MRLSNSNETVERIIQDNIPSDKAFGKRKKIVLVLMRSDLITNNELSRELKGRKLITRY